MSPASLQPTSLPVEVGGDRRDWGWDLAYVGFMVLLFQEVFLGGARIIERDLLHYFYPIGQQLRQAFLGEGSFWWDTGIDHGMPLAARWAPAVFYPAHWLFALLRVDLAISAAILIHFPIAATAMRRLALRYTDSLPAAWLAGLGFAFGGYLVSMVGGGIYLYGAALLPLSLLALHRLVEQPRLPRALQLACVLALQALAADPQTLFFELAFCLPAVVWLRAPRGGRVRVLAAAALAGALALVVSWCQVWPTLELAGRSIRATGFGYEEATRWSLHPLRLIEWLVPGILGNLFPDPTYWGGWLSNGPVSGRPWATALHLGLVPLLSIVAIRRADRRSALVWGGLAALSLLLAMGRWTPVYTLAMWVPGVDRFRYPEKHLLYLTLALAVLAAIGLGHVFRAVRQGERGVGRVMVALAAVAAVVAAAWIWASADRERLGAFIFSKGALVVTSEAARATASALARALAIAVASLAVLALRARIRGSLAVALLLAIGATQLLLAGLPLRLLGGKGWVTRPPAICEVIAADSARPMPLVTYSRMDFEGDPAGLVGPVAPTERHRRWEHFTGKPNVAAPFCVRYANGYDAATLRVHADLRRALADPRREMDLFGVRYLIARPRQLPASYPQRAELRDWRVAIHENPGALPYAHPIASAIRADGSGDAIARVADPAFDFRRAVVLEGGSARSFPGAVRRAVVRRHRAGAIELSVDFEQPGYLLLLESHYPGWKAWSDERPIAVQRANGAFLGLEIPAGKHRVRLAFVPDRQRVANRVSLVGLGILGALTAVALWRRRRAIRNPS